MTSRDRHQTDGIGVALAIHLSIYSFVFGLFAMGLYALLQPARFPNPGVAAYKPPPDTVISWAMPPRLLAAAEHVEPVAAAQPEPDLTDGRASPEVPATAVEVQAPKPKRQEVKPLPEQGDSPRNTFAAYPMYSGDRPF
jgi:hypothetical protein